MAFDQLSGNLAGMLQNLVQMSNDYSVLLAARTALRAAAPQIKAMLPAPSRTAPTIGPRFRGPTMSAAPLAGVLVVAWIDEADVNNEGMSMRSFVSLYVYRASSHRDLAIAQFKRDFLDGPTIGGRTPGYHRVPYYIWVTP